MKRARCIMLIVALAGFLLVSAGEASARKKVAVVLSGGGAKGVAHIGALRIIEQAGIPIDIVVGTSMGSIVGGLYSIGYTPDQLDSIVMAQNWAFLLSDRTPRRHQPFPEKEADDKYQIKLPFSKKFTTTGGLIKGVNVEMLLDRLMVDYRDSMDFGALPIPFACVASDIVTGEAAVYHEGVLPVAIRASMAIPGVFTPVYIDSMVLVDGGLFNNFPTDVARKMGADVIIGVDVQESMHTRAELENAGAGTILGQIMDIAMGKATYDENVDLADVYIKVNVEGYSAASFNLPALDSLIHRGERRASEQWDELTELKHSIGVSDDFAPPHHEPYVAQKTYTPDYRRRAKLGNTLSAGVEFDTEEIAALIISGTFRFGKKVPMEASLTGRLGKRLMAGADFMFSTSPLSSFKIGYTFNRDNIVINNNGRRAFNPIYNHHTAQFSYVNMNFLRQNLRLEVGLAYEHFFFSDNMLTSRHAPPIDLRDEGLVSYFARVDFETIDSRLFTMRGTAVSGQVELYTDNFYQYIGRAPLPSVALAWTTAFPVAKRFSLIPAIYGRLVPDKNVPLGKRNAIGGRYFGRYLPSQMPFDGVGFMEVAPHTFVAARLQMRGRIGVRHFVSGSFNYGIGDDDCLSLFKTGRNYFGASLDYGYNFRIIPIMVSLNWSNVTRTLGFYVQAGYMF